MRPFVRAGHAGSSAPRPLRLLYLGFAFPPGVQPLFPGCNPAGHAFETGMVTALRAFFDLRSVGVLPFEPPRLPAAAPASGIAHDLLLLDRAPELFHRLRSLARLKAQYRRWRALGWEPDAVLVYNLSPIYNRFLLWLERRAPQSKRVLLLLDSASLGRPIPWLKRFRHRFKPLCVPDTEMLGHFEGCIGLSRTVEEHVRPRQLPFLWMPGGCSPGRALPPQDFPPEPAGPFPLRLGYFGALAAHAGVKPLVEAFLASDLPATLELCGYGKLGPDLAGLARDNPRLKYHGWLAAPEDCLRFGQSCQVLVNPRPATHGNENSFPSKLFDYALCGRAILTSQLSGVEEVLGPAAYYFDPRDFTHSLNQRLWELAGTPAHELRQRGAAIQQRILGEFSWEQQAARIAGFLEETCARKPAGAPCPSAAAA
jgi:glycosyltransferase involved in cell wall biosynthesis